MLSDHCPVGLSVCLSVYCSQTVAWIKMKLGTQVGLGPITLCYRGTQLPPKEAETPNFPPMSVVAKRLDGLRCHLVWR